MKSLTRRRMMVAGVGAAIAVSLPVLAHRTGLAVHQRPGVAFGTTVALTVLHRDAALAEAALDAGFAEIRAIETVANLQDATSDISRLNRDGYIERADGRLLDLLQLSGQTARLTQGAFDITVQPYWLTWTAAQTQLRAPTEGELRATQARVGHDYILVAGTAVRFARPDMGITLNGIARGYACDRVMDIMRQHGIEHAFLDTDAAGAAGTNMDKPWGVGIEHPRKTGKFIGEVRPLTGFVSTSGDYETTFSPNFRDNHIFVPATGRSPTELCSATIIAPSGALADSLSPAAMVMGAERTLSLVSAMPATHAILVRKSGEVLTTPAAPFVPTSSNL